MSNVKCKREEWCQADVTRTYLRADWPHYWPDDPRRNLPFEIVRTCDQHPMGDGQDGMPDFGWQRVWQVPDSEDGSRDLIVTSDPSLPPRAGQIIGTIDKDGNATRWDE